MWWLLNLEPIAICCFYAGALDNKMEDRRGDSYRDPPFSFPVAVSVGLVCYFFSLSLSQGWRKFA